MELLNGVFAEDLFIYLPKYRTFILSDIHLGYEESLNRQGILIPRNNYADLLSRLEKTLEYLKRKNRIENIIVNGDLIHEFGKISVKEKELTKKFIKFLSGYGKLTLVVGNHDGFLKYFVSAIEEVKVENYVILGDVLILHGDKIPSGTLLKNNSIKTIIVGHEHPSVALSSGTRSEKYKCFLIGKYERRDIVVMPSCNLFIEGTDVLREKLLSPLLKKANILNFEVYVVEDQIYDFGKVKNLMRQK